MAGEHIALLRLMRLMNPLKSTVTSKEFVDLRIFKSLATLLLLSDFWKYLFVMVRSLYAPMRVLRLADQKTAAMDKLYYFVCQTDRMLPKYLKEAESRAEHLLTEETVALIKLSNDAASVSVNDNDEEDEECHSESSNDNEDVAELETELEDSDMESDAVVNTVDSGEQWAGDGLVDTVMRFWILRRSKLVYPYSLVGYILSPVPKIIEHAKANRKMYTMEQVSKHLLIFVSSFASIPYQ